MKIPDKIYLQVCGDCPEEDCENCEFSKLEDNVTWCKDSIFEKDKEYISKDTLLEWAKIFYAISMNDMERKTMQKVIDKINSL